MALASFDEQFEDRYALLRRKLILFFSSRRANASEDLADEVFVRVLKKRADGVVIENIDKFAYGVAKFVLLESRRGPKTVAIESDGSVEGSGPGALTPKPLITMPAAVDDNATDRACLKLCLADLPGDKREMLMAYYSIEPGSASYKDLRQHLAERHEMNLPALHTAIYRIRSKVADCTKLCVEKKLSTKV